MAGHRGKSDIWQAKTCRRKKLANGDRRAVPKHRSLQREVEDAIEYFWANRPKPKNFK